MTLRQSGNVEDSLITGQALVALYDRIFLVGQSFLPAVNDLLLGILLYQSRLVPRALSLIGIIGAPLLICGAIAILFGFIEQRASMAALSALLVALFEFSLGIWLIIKRFNPSASIIMHDKTDNIYPK